MGSKGKIKRKTKSGVTGELAQNNGHGKVISDPRFASVHSDPRFREAPRKKTKVAIDSRFNRMFTDTNFASTKARIDKRGKQKKDASQDKLKHYYRLEEEEEEEKGKGEKEIVELKRKKNVESKSGEEEESESESEIEKEESESEESESEKEELQRKISKMKSESESSESESEEEDEDDEESNDSASTSTTDSDEEEDGIDFEEDDTFMQPEEHVPEIDNETHRLAVVNMDWSQVQAVDLYVLLSSFLPKEGQIKSVAVYPTEFGLKRIEEERVRGPVGLFDDDKEDNKNVDDDDDGDDDDDDDDDDEIDEKKLRAYELSRLRYYVAVVECDSIATADYLYKTCDGVEFERSSVKLDLRFIPDSMEFKHQPRDVATEAPTSYEGLDFQTRALQQSKVHVSWDDDEPQRVKALKRKFNDDQLAELELKEFLASDESETDGDEIDNDLEDISGKKNKKQDMYRSLLESGNGSDENDEEDGQDMEVTFNTGLEDISKRILEKKDKKSETVWEAYLRKKKEKKKARKNKSKNSSEDDSSDTDQEPVVQPDDFFIEEPSAKGSKGTGKRAQKGKLNPEASQEAEASRAELELLFADDNGDPSLKGYNLKRKLGKGKKGKEVPDEGKIPTTNYDDPRFSALFDSPLFALDPTDPQFKRSAAYVRQLSQKQHKSDAENIAGKEQVELAREAHSYSKSEERDEHLQSDDLPLQTEKHELSSLVRSIKMKSIQVPKLLSNGKVAGSQPPTKKRKGQRAS